MGACYIPYKEMVERDVEVRRMRRELRRKLNGSAAPSFAVPCSDRCASCGASGQSLGPCEYCGGLLRDPVKR
jgi:hypothetical protein